MILLFSFLELEPVIREGLFYAYQELYREAESCFVMVLDSYPEHPAGYFFLAGLKGLYIIDLGKYELYPEMKALVDSCVKKGKRWIKKNPDDAWGYFFIGGAYTYLTFFHALREDYVNTLGYGIKALSWVSRAVEIDSTLYDAYLGLGGYDYFKGIFPWWRSEKKRGLRKIELAMRKGRFSHELAADGLAQIYIREKKYKEAEDLLFSLLEQYPLSRTFRWPLVEIYMEEGRWEDALRVVREMREVSRGKENTPYVELSLALLEGKALVAMGREKEAQEILGKALDIECTNDEERKVKREIEKIYRRISP